jgi:hypothetical protein
MRRSMVIGAAILAVLAVIGIGVAAFNAGVDQGVSQQLARTGDAQQVVRVVGPGWGYGRGFGFPFGLILFPLFIVGIVLLLRGAFWRGRWGGGPRWWGPGYGPGGPGYGPGYGRPWGGPEAFDEYHRRLHDQPGTPAGPPEEGGGFETPTDRGTA